VERVDALRLQRLRDELPRVYKRVLARAVVFARNRRVQAFLGADSNAARVAEDLVQEAVMRTMSGERTWDPERVDLEHFLVQAVRSIADSYKHRGSLRAASYDDELGVPDCPDPAPPTQSPVPDGLLGRKQAISKLENELIEAASDDDELLQLVEAMLSGEYLPRELEAALGWDNKKVNVVLKKLRRRMARLRGQGELS
jgi:DNA-directed RNA polymerase specialized sigma24 family protein